MPPPSQPRIVRAERLDAPVRVPVAIVGGGACGLIAAIALRDAAVECVVLERDAVPSGSTALSSGFIPAAGTRTQAAQDIGDSTELFAEDIVNKSKATAAPHLVHAYTQAVAPALDRLGEHGLRFEVLTGFLYPGHRVHRMHTLRERTGAALVAAMHACAGAAGADVLTSARVVELWADPQDRILGVGMERPGGAMEHIACDVLLLACNGFGGYPVRCVSCCRRCAMPCSPGTPAMTAAPSCGARRWARHWPTWAPTRATAPGWCRRGRS